MTLLDPNPWYKNHCEGNKANGDEYTAQLPFAVIPYPLNEDGTDLTSRDDDTYRQYYQ